MPSTRSGAGVGWCGKCHGERADPLGRNCLWKKLQTGRSRSLPRLLHGPTAAVRACQSETARATCVREDVAQVTFDGLRADD